jgi:integrase
MPLKDTFVRTVKATDDPAGKKYPDEKGMYLLVKEAGKYWRMDYRYLGKRKTLALGVYPDVSLAKARQKRDEAREQLADGVDPSEAKRKAKQLKADAAANTFEAIATDWLARTKASRASSTQEKVSTWLKKDVFPTIGKRPISEINARDVLAMLRKIEARGAIESAHRIKQICGQIFRYGVATGSAARDVTADLKGALAAIPKTHYAAITEPAEVGGLMRAIHAYTGHPYAAAALKLAPLVFVRPGMLRAMEWCEIDFDAGEWRIPESKMKKNKKLHTGQDHIVPLAMQAIDILRTMQPLTGHGKYVFPSIRTSERCMSENTINAALRAMGYGKDVMTGHGFRAMARTILDEVVGERVDLVEHQLAHVVRDPLGRAYNRTKHMPARRAMMQRWADYLDQLRKGADVVPLRSGTA